MKLSKERKAEYEEIEAMRKELGLPPLLDVKKRTCLVCECGFTSSSHGDRICAKCKPPDEHDAMSWLYAKKAPSKNTLKMRKYRRRKK